MDYLNPLIDELDPARKATAQQAPKIGGMDLGQMGEPGGVAGPAAQGTPDVGPPAAAPSWSPGAKAGQKVTLLGFDSGKLEDPGSGSAAGSKYTGAAKAFYNGLKQDVGLSRGGLDNMTNYLKANGFGNAKAVGDDKIDFGDGNGPVDVIRSDGQIVFQNTTGNPTWEGQYGHGDGGAAPGGGGGMFAGSTISPLLQSDAQSNIQNALGGLSQPTDFLQQLIAQLQGGR